jgi:hypothetical protein
MKKTTCKILTLLAAAMLIMAGVTACASGPDDRGDAGIRGQITTVNVAVEEGDILGNILVEGTAEENTGLASDKASVTLTVKTVLVSGSDKKYLEAADMRALAIGTKVEVVFTGPVAESYPVQGEGKVLRILTQ